MLMSHWKACILVLIKCIVASESPKQVSLELPTFHVVRNDNYLFVRIHGIVSTETLELIIRLKSSSSNSDSHQVLIVPSDGDVQITGDIASVRLSCKYFPISGVYSLMVIHKDSDNITQTLANEELNVKTPDIILTARPAAIKTYPDEPVSVRFQVSDICNDPSDESLLVLELVFCGDEQSCSDDNTTVIGRHIIYTETLHKRDLSLYKSELSCQLFGQAGNYAVQLRDGETTRRVVAFAMIQVIWSDRFVFDVHATSIYPCDGMNDNGIGVLFQYPSCILNDGDRVRVYAKRRVDVASLAPPTSLHYITEKRVTKGRHSMRFDCELFSEAYVEYCFVYVSRAITGAVMDVRMVCIPTLPPVQAGGWGPWSSWTACSETCGPGTRTRYRVCDDPSPHYGAAYCKGESVDSEECGIAADHWQCLYGGSLAAIAERGESVEEMDPSCRCGCVLHLGRYSSRRLIATSSQSCPGRAFWLIQADPGHIVLFKIEYYRLPCVSQWVKLRDGESLSSMLLGHLEPGIETSQSIQGRAPAEIVSSGVSLLLEFNSNELLASSEECTGEIMAYAQQIVSTKANRTNPEMDQYSSDLDMNLSMAYVAAFAFVGIIILLSGILGSQYMLRYRKYELAEDLESLVETRGSDVYIPLQGRSVSNATLLSEVISMVRFKPRSVASKDFQFQLAAEKSSSAESVHIIRADITTDKENREYTNDSTVCYDEPSASNEKSNVEEKMQNTDINKGSETKLTAGFYSPGVGKISVAKIRSMNHKENKEKLNREKVLSDPGSELSLSNADLEMEMDYYDYNVINAGAIPGSYLGMDPAFLIWIPPLDNDDSLNCTENHYEEILPRNYAVSPCSNKESPEEESPEILNKHDDIKKCNNILNKNIDVLNCHSNTDSNILEEEQMLPMKELIKGKQVHNQPIGVHHIILQKPTTQSKEQSVKKVDNPRWLDDIQFADDDESEIDFEGPTECDNRCRNDFTNEQHLCHNNNA